MHATASEPQSRLSSAPAFLIAVLVLLAAAWLVYLPGLKGTFLFDDLANLPTLGAFGPIDNASTFWRYITSGTADPTGRPLALLSFLVDARNWPADPYPFKRTGVLLHLANGALLAMLLLRLGRALVGDTLRARAAAWLGAALWLLHPLLVSTTLYIVQREAMLPATFTLLGLLGYCAGRERAARGSAGGVWLAAGSIALCTVLGVLCKANGVLLPMLAWLVEVIVLAPAQPIGNPGVARRFASMQRLVLGVPSVLVIVALGWAGIRYAIHGAPAFRPWTFGERLISEPRVIADYLRLLLMPHPYTSGLFNDSFRASTSLFSPLATLPCVVLVAGLLAGAIAVRKRVPALSLAVLFYFAGQILESTVIPLELYYEHRNYLPALLLFWPIALWITGDGVLPIVRRALFVILPLLFAGMTWMRCSLWGNAQDQALLWARKNPDSPRAQAYAAQTERARGDPPAAIARLTHVSVAPDEDMQIVLNLIGARCDLGAVPPADIERADTALRNARVTGQLGYNWFAAAIGSIAAGHACQGLGPPEIERLLDAAAANPHGQDSYGRKQDNFNLRGQLALAMHDPAKTLDEFNAALDVNPGPAVALEQAAALGSAGYPAQALTHLDHLKQIWIPAPMPGFSMRALHSRLLLREGYWQNEIAHLRNALSEDAAQSGAGAPAT